MRRAAHRSASAIARKIPASFAALRSPPARSLATCALKSGAQYLSTVSRSSSIHGIMAGRQLAHAPENRPRMRNVLVRQVVIERRRIDLARQPRHLQQTLQFAGKQQSVRLAAIHQRFLAQAVATQHESPVPRIPDGDREHPVEMREALDAEVLVQVDDRLAIAVRAKHVPGSLQTTAQGAKVVDLAVEDDPHACRLRWTAADSPRSRSMIDRRRKPRATPGRVPRGSAT